MKLKLLLLLILGLIGYTAGTLVAGYLIHSKPVIAQSPNKAGSIVRLVRNGKTFCSGTVISDHLIITAAHCVLIETPFGSMTTPDTIDIRDNENVELGVTAQVNFATSQMDQAILFGDFTKFEHRPIHTKPEFLAALAAPSSIHSVVLTSCGYPLGGDLYCTSEMYKRPRDFFWEVTGTMLPGMSGGPSMLPDGSVVAVNTAVTGSVSIVSPIYNLTKNIRRDGN